MRMFGRNLRTWLDNLKLVAKDNRPMDEGRKLKLGDDVLARAYSGNQNKWAYGTVIKVMRDRYYKVNIDGKLHRSHINQLIMCKKRYQSTDDNIFIDKPLTSPQHVNNSSPQNTTSEQKSVF